MKSVRITVGIVLLLMSLMFFSCTSESGKRQPRVEEKPETVKRVVKLLGESYVMSRQIDTMYVPGDTVRLLLGTSMATGTALAVVIR